MAFVSKIHLSRMVIFRFVIASVILAAHTAIFGLNSTPIYFLIAFVYILTIIYSLLLLLKIYNTFFLYAQILLDLLIETLLVHYTGGIDSAVSLLYPLSSIAASILISPRAGILFALLGSIFYSGIIALEYFKFLPLDESIAFVSRESYYVFSLLYFRVTVFCIIGFLGAYIAEQVKKKDREVLSLEEKLRREDRLSAIGKLAASTAHEIRNPLASISGCVEALKENLTLDKDNEKLFDLIIKETARLNNIINGLLEYVKPRTLKLEKVVLDELLDEVITLVSNSRDFKKGTQIKKENNQPLLQVICDSQQIRQVFFNLLVNAVEAVRENGIIIVNVQTNKADNVVEIAVIDDGCGMNKGQLMNLFTPFSSGKNEGVGLGLAIAYNIVKEHQGGIEVESKSGKGSVFTVFLPLKKNIEQTKNP